MLGTILGYTYRTTRIDEASEGIDYPPFLSNIDFLHLKEDPFQDHFPQTLSCTLLLLEKTLGVILPDITRDIFTNLNLSVVVFIKERLLENCDQLATALDGYVFLITDTSKLKIQIIEVLQCYNRTTLKLKTKRIVIVHMNNSSLSMDYDPSLYLRYFHWFWENYGLVHVIIYPIFEKQDMISTNRVLLGYNPFIQSGILLRSEISEDFVSKQNSRFLDLQGYSLNATLFPFNFSAHPLLINRSPTIRGGPDVAIRWTLESYFNLRFAIRNTRDNSFEGHFMKGAFTGPLADVLENYIDIALNVNMMKWYNTPKVQFLMPRLCTALVVIVGSKGRIQGWRMALHIFQWQVWVWLMFAVVISSVFSLLLAKYRLSNDDESTVAVQSSEAVFLVLKSILSLSVSVVPRNNPERLLMASCLLVSVIVINIFFGQLFYLIKSKPQLANIDSLQELQDADLPIYTPLELFLDAFDGLQNSSLSKLKDRLFYKSYADLGWNNGVIGKLSDRHAVIFTSTLVQFQMEANPVNFDKEIHIVKENVLQFCLGQMMPIGSVFYGHFNQLIERLVELGFFIKWRREYTSFVRELRDYDKSTDRKIECDFDYLTFNDLKLAFWILFIGLVLSLFSFIGEIYMNRLSRIM
ncbi:hypothetical protein J6590_021551 [Homalodisca vitripennis]|nr:hypothetical protein J6590_021551 [Homalodisca vitripennis]